jgi:hypothetical protein
MPAYFLRALRTDGGTNTGTLEPAFHLRIGAIPARFQSAFFRSVCLRRRGAEKLR